MKYVMFVKHIDGPIKLECGIRISPGYSIKVFQMRVQEAISEDFQRNIFLIFSYKCVHQYNKYKELCKCLFLKPAGGMA